MPGTEDKPAFDPNQSFEPVSAKPAFDPNKAFEPAETVKKKSGNAPSKTIPPEQPLKPSTSPPASPTQSLNVPTALEAMKSQSGSSTSGSADGKSASSAPKFEVPKAALPAQGSLYQVKQIPEMEKESADQLQAHIRDTILGKPDQEAKKATEKAGQKPSNNLNTKESIDAYANKLNLLGYSKGTTEQLKQYAVKLNEAAPALKQINEELKANPGSRDALFHLGTISLNTGDYKVAANAFHAALNNPEEDEQPTQGAEGNPYPKKTTDAALLYGIGQAMQKMGNNEQALKSYNEALKADPNSINAESAVRGMAELAWHNNDKEVARHLLEKSNAMADQRRKSTANLEERAAEYDEQKKHENDTRDYLNNIANGLEGMVANLTGVKSLGEGIDSGINTLKQASISLNEGNTLTGGLQIAQGVAHIGMGTLAATPEGFLFNTVVGGAQEILPEKLTEFLMAPVTGALNFITDNPNDAQKAIASFGDILAQALLLKSAHTGFEDLKGISEKFKNNEPLNSEEVQKVQAAVPELTDVLPEATQKVEGDNAHKVQDAKLDRLAAVKQLFETELKKEGLSEEAKNVLQKHIAETDEAIDKRTQEVHEEAHKDAEQTVIEDKIKALNKDLEGTDNEDLKATYQAQIDELTKSLTKKPTENEQNIKNEPTGRGNEEPANGNGQPGNISQETETRPEQNGPAKEQKGSEIKEFTLKPEESSETLKQNENATKEGQKPQNDQQQHQGAAPRENVSENEGEVGGGKSKPPGGSNSTQPGPEGKKVTGIKKEQVKKERLARYAGIIDTKSMSTSDAKVFDDAHKILEENGPDYARTLAEKLSTNPDVASATDQAVLLIDRVDLTNSIDDIDKRIEDARTAGNTELEALLGLQRGNLEKAMDVNDKAAAYTGTKLGQALAIRRRLLGLDYSLQRLTNNWYLDNPGQEITPEVKARLKGFEKEINELNSKLAESNQKLQAEREARAIENIKQSVARVNEKIAKAPKKSYAEQAKVVSDRIRKLKNKPIELKDKNGNPIDLTKLGLNWNDIVDGVADAIDKVGEIADKVAQGVKDYLEKAEWYKKMDYMDQEAIRKQIESHFSEEAKPKVSRAADVVYDETGNIKSARVPASMIREYVANGITNIDDLTAKIHSELVKDHPNLTERQVRDAITGYGEQINKTKPELEVQISRMKRQGVLISKIEDAKAGLRPLRKLLNKDKIQDKERELGRKLNELLKDLPPDEVEAYRKIKTASDAKLTRLNNQIADLSKRIEDLKAGREPEKTTKKAIPTTPEILEAERKRDELKAQATELEGKQELTDQEYLDKWKQRAQSLQKKYEAKIANKDYSVNKKRELVHDQESSKILGELEKVKKRYQAERLAEQEKNTSNAIKAMKTIAKIPRAVILTSLNIFGKIGSFNLGEAAFLPIKELTQAVLSKLPYIGDIIRQAPTHGGGEFNVKAISKAYAELFNPRKLWKSWKEIAKTGQTDAGLKYGEHLPPIITDYWSKIDHWLELPGKTHAMVHEPLIRAKEAAFVEKYKAFYDKKYQDNIEEAVKNGENVQDPVFLSFLQGKAYKAAYDDALLGKNKLSTAWNQFIRFLETPSKKHATSSNFGGQAAATGFKVLIPITTVPVNIANAIIDYSGAGLAKAVADLTAAGIKEAGKHEQSTFAAILHEGFKNMSEKDKEAFTRHITRGTIGAFLFWYGFHNRKNIGGIPLPGHHEKPGEEKPLHMRYFGYELPHWFHLPQLGGIEIGATFGHAYDYYKGEGGTPKTEAAVAVGKHVFESLPMLNEDVQLYKAFQSGERGLRFAGDFAKNALIPKPIQEGIPFLGIPGALPVNAHPKGFSETFLSRKPSTPQEKEQAEEEDIYAKRKKQEQEPTPEQQKVAEEKEKASDEKARIKEIKYQYQRFKNGDMSAEEKKNYVNSEDYLEYKKSFSK